MNLKALIVPNRPRRCRARRPVLSFKKLCIDNFCLCVQMAQEATRNESEKSTLRIPQLRRKHHEASDRYSGTCDRDCGPGLCPDRKPADPGAAIAIPAREGPGQPKWSHGEWPAAFGQPGQRRVRLGPQLL